MGRPRRKSGSTRGVLRRMPYGIARRLALVVVSGMLLALGCQSAREETSPSSSSDLPPPSPTVDAARTVDAGPSGKLIPDEALGPLVARLSERPGDFPSENYVTNETSLLHVAQDLREPRLRGRAYVGVGPEQSYTYLALLEPRVAYIVDIRRGNLLEHLVFRGCFEEGVTRVGFLRALLAREPRSEPVQGPGFSPLEAAFRGVAADPSLEARGVTRTRALLDRLAIVRSSTDERDLVRIHRAFARHGLAIAYSMVGSERWYPTLAQNLAATEGDVGTFLASDEAYSKVRRMVLENRVLPVVGDFGGTHALRAVGEDMRSRGLTLGVLYASNVEQYLFEQRKHGTFVESVAAMPHDDASRLVHVWFDAGKRHPAQREGHRTTELAVSLDAFVTRGQRRPYRSFWEVVTAEATN